MLDGVDSHASEHGTANLRSENVSRRDPKIRTGTTYEAKEVGEIVPPKVGLCDRAGNKPEDHGDDGQTDEDGVKRYKTLIGCRRVTTHQRRDVLSRCSTPSA